MAGSQLPAMDAINVMRNLLNAESGASRSHSYVAKPGAEQEVAEVPRNAVDLKVERAKAA